MKRCIKCHKEDFFILVTHPGAVNQVNMEMGLLDKRRGDAIVQAATEVGPC